MSNIIAPGLYALSVFRDDNGTTHQLNGKDVAPDSYIRRTEINSRITPSGSDRYITETWEALINHHDGTFAAAMEQAMKAAEAKWMLCAAGFMQSVLWYEESYVLEPERASMADPSSTDAPYQFLMRQTRHKPKIRAAVNILDAMVKMQGFATGWQDSNVDGVADGFQVDGTVVSTDFDVTDTQIITTENPAQLRPLDYEGSVVTFPFPISGVELTASVDFKALHGSADNNVQVNSQDYGGSTIASNTETATATGRKGSFLSLPSNVYKLRIEVPGLANVTASDSVQVLDPALRIGDSTEYTDY